MENSNYAVIGMFLSQSVDISPLSGNVAQSSFLLAACCYIFIQKYYINHSNLKVFSSQGKVEAECYDTYSDYVTHET